MDFISNCINNIPSIYSISLMIVFIIGALEGLLALIGFGLSNILEEVFDFDMDTDLPDTNASALTEGLSWINKGRVPVIMLGILFLGIFGGIGSALHCSFPMTMIISLPLTLVLSVFSTRWFSSILGKIMPKDETTAVSKDSFIGRTATITLGTATKEKFAEAKLTDVFGNTHYIMIKPEDDVSVKQRETLIVSEKLENEYFLGIVKEKSE